MISTQRSLQVLFFALLNFCVAAKEIDVSVSVDKGNQVLIGSPVTLKCEYEGKDLNSADHVITVGWNIGEEGNTTSIAFFSYGNPTPITYPTNSYQPPAYVMTMDYGAQIGSSEFTIQSVDMNDNRSFRCSVNALLDVKEGTGIAAVVVNVLPSSVTISSSDEHTNNSDVTVISGITETFTCTAIGSNPPSTLSWTLNGLPQPGGPSDDNDISTISLSPQWMNHRNVLRCKASVPADDVGVHTNVILDVKVPPTDNNVKLIDDKQPDGYTNGSFVRVDDEMSHAFTCEVSNTRPASHIEWYLGPDKVIDGITTPTPPGEGNDLKNYSSTLLLMVDVNRHRKHLNCDASIDVNGAPDPVQKYIVLDVYGAPTDHTLSGNTDLTENIKEQFTCEAKNGYPQGRIEWYNNDINITQSPANNTENENNRFDVRSFLEFVPKRDDNQHTIICQVVNEVSKQMKSLLINVKYSADIIKTDNQVSVDEGQNATLYCAVNGNPTPYVTWYDKSGNRSDNRPRTIIEESTDDTGTMLNSSLTITGVIPDEDYGNYTCNGSNSIGSESFVISLSGLSIPDVPTDIDILDKESTNESLKVQWNRGHNGGVLQWFLVYYRQDNDDVKMLYSNITEIYNQEIYDEIINNLTAGEEYYITVSSGNRIGMNSGYELKEPGITLPSSPEQLGIEIIYERNSHSVTVEGIPKDENYKCLQLYSSEDNGGTWSSILECLNDDITDVIVATTINAIQGSYCVKNVCGEHTKATYANSPPHSGLGLIVGASVAGIVLIAIIIGLVIYLLRTSKPPKGKETSSKNGDVELSLSNGTGQGVDNPAISTSDIAATYAVVDKTKKAQDNNAPTYAAVNKTKTSKNTDQAGESGYDDVANRNPTTNRTQSGDGKTVNADGLIYQEVSHFKSHPVDAPPIQTEASTEYASLDFNLLKSNKK